MFDELLSTLKAECRSVVMTLISAAVAAMAGAVAVLFMGVAIFIWAADNYGSLPASLAMAAFFPVVALIAAAILLSVRHKAARRAMQRAEQERREREEAARYAPPAWMDPALIPALLPIGIKAVGIALRHRGLLLALLGSAAVGFAMLRERNGDEKMPAAEQPQPAE